MLPQLDGWEEAMKRKVDSPSSYPYDVADSQDAWVAESWKRRHPEVKPAIDCIQELALSLKPGNATEIGAKIFDITKRMRSENDGA